MALPSDESAVRDGGEDQGAEEGTVYGAEEGEESSRRFWKEPVSRERLLLFSAFGPSLAATVRLPYECDTLLAAGCTLSRGSSSREYELRVLALQSGDGFVALVIALFGASQTPRFVSGVVEERLTQLNFLSLNDTVCRGLRSLLQGCTCHLKGLAAAARSPNPGGSLACCKHG